MRTKNYDAAFKQEVVEEFRQLVDDDLSFEPPDVDILTSAPTVSHDDEEGSADDDDVR